MYSRDVKIAKEILLWFAGYRKNNRVCNVPHTHFLDLKCSSMKYLYRIIKMGSVILLMEIFFSESIKLMDIKYNFFF